MGEGNKVVSIDGVRVAPEVGQSDGWVPIHEFRRPGASLHLAPDGDAGTWLCVSATKGADEQWYKLLRHSFSVVAEIQTERGKKAGYLVQYTDEGRQENGVFPIVQDVLPRGVVGDLGRFRDWLAARNINVLIATPVLGTLTVPGVLAAYLTASNHDRKIEERPVCGWVKGLDAYLLGTEVLGSQNYRPSLAAVDTAPPALTGSVDGWITKVCPVAARHPVWIFGVLVAMAAPLMKLLKKGDYYGGFHFHGDSSTGKSIAGELAAGFYGHKPRTWRITANALEWAAAMHNHNVLVLDEIHMADADAVDAAAYMLGNGRGKERMGRDLKPVEALEFGLMTISAGEKSIEDALPRAAYEGEIVRFMDIPMIERSLNTLEVAEFKEMVKNEQQGHIGRLWVKHLAGMSETMAQAPQGERLAHWRGLHKKYLRMGIEYADARDPRVVRVWQRLATMMVAVDVAAEDLILPRSWTEELPNPEPHGFNNLCTRAIKTVYDRWAEAVGIVRGSRSALSGARTDARRLLLWLDERQASDKVGEFTATEAPSPKGSPDAFYLYDGTSIPRNRQSTAAYIETVIRPTENSTGGPVRYLWVTDEQLMGVSDSLKPRRFSKAMDEAGVLVTAGKRRKSRLPTVRWMDPVRGSEDFKLGGIAMYRLNLNRLQTYVDGEA